MTPAFFKFPSTPHLTLLGTNSVRDDKVFSKNEMDGFLEHELMIEEKMDGANLGISFDSSGNLNLQNRGSYLLKPYSGQWKRLVGWLPFKLEFIFDCLQDRYILFGEWCFARHSVWYNNLPDWFLGFDIFDKQAGRFLSCKKRDKMFKRMNIFPIPLIGSGCFTLKELKEFFRKSVFSNTSAEGIYLRYDKGAWLEDRAKLVRPEFIQAIETHWSGKGIIPNKLKDERYY